MELKQEVCLSVRLFFEWSAEESGKMVSKKETAQFCVKRREANSRRTEAFYCRRSAFAASLV